MVTRFRPKIIAITGSVGKTTTKHAIAHVLKRRFSVLQTFGNYNTEFGLPLSILELKAPSNKSIASWWNLIISAFKKAYSATEYYEVLVLEMGADKPGDIALLMNIVEPDISVVTNVGTVHLQNYRTQDELAYEKATILRMAPLNTIGFVNYDNNYTRNMQDIAESPESIKSFGLSHHADIYAKDIKMDLLGLKSTICYGAKSFELHCPHILGKHNIYSLLVACGVALEMNMEHKEIMTSLRTFQLPNRRMSLVVGKKNTRIIDSTYNAEPQSMKAALETLRDMPFQSRKIAVIGDMLELGNGERILHEEIGQFAHTCKFDLVCFVGPRMKWAFDQCNAKTNEFRRSTMYYEDSTIAAHDLIKKIKPEDIILIKGSNSMDMIRIVDELRA
jgi:UDP-N-acetylmuramoyl-tripeptide--D-alanyl-D-alanine ligase